MTRTFIFPKRNFVKLKFLKFLVCRLNMLRLKTFSFLNAILKITLIEKYLPITMQPPQLFREQNRGPTMLVDLRLDYDNVGPKF